MGSHAGDSEFSPEHRIQSARRGNLLVIGAGSLLLLASAGVLTHLFSTRSRDAVVEAETINLTTPIDGELGQLSIKIGSPVKPGQHLARVVNTRASDTELERLRTAWSTAQSRVEKTSAELEAIRQQEAKFAIDAKDQRQLETAKLRNDINQIQAEMLREQHEVDYSQRDLTRQQQLYRAGAVSGQVVDRANTTMLENRQQLASIQARLRSANNQLQAAQRDLSLERTRGNIDPTPRQEETQLKRKLLVSEMRTRQKLASGLKAEMLAAEKQLNQQQAAWITAPLQAVVSRLLAHSGDNVKVNQKVMQLIDCKQRWLTTTVSENMLKRLKIGERARIDLIGESMDLNGSIELIRSGMGRLGAINEDPTPLAPGQKPLSQVRVRILNDVPAPPEKLCFVGYGAKVIFK